MPVNMRPSLERVAALTWMMEKSAFCYLCSVDFPCEEHDTDIEDCIVLTVWSVVVRWPLGSERGTASMQAVAVSMRESSVCVSVIFRDNSNS